MISFPGTGSTALALLLAAAATGSACAMNPTSTEGLTCVVNGEEKLPPDLGGEAAICSAIRRATAPVLQRTVPAGKVSVTVDVRSAYAISAVTTVGARSLPENRVDISDRPLNRRAIDMLAQAIAAELAKTAQE